MESTLAKLTASDAVEICRRFVVDSPMDPLPASGPSPAVFLSRLMKAGKWLDAMRFLAYGLPTREAVWWSCQCLRGLYGDCGRDNVVPGTLALEAAEAWVYRPTAANRQAAGAVARRSGYEDPWDWVAAAAHWSALPPQPTYTHGSVHLSAYAVESALSLAVSRTEADNASPHYRRFVLRGIDVANGGTGRT